MHGDAFLDEYISWVEAQRTSPTSEPNFLYLTTWAGLANRLIALLSAFALALATKRILVLDEDALPEPLLAPPVAWDVDSWPQFARLRTAQQAAVGEGKGWVTTDTPGWVTIDTERKPFDATLERLGCANLSVAYPQRVLHFHSIAQYLVPLLQLNGKTPISTPTPTLTLLTRTSTLTPTLTLTLTITPTLTLTLTLTRQPRRRARSSPPRWLTGGAAGAACAPPGGALRAGRARARERAAAAPDPRCAAPRSQRVGAPPGTLN